MLERHAIFDSQRFYRYSLSRTWDSTKDKVVFVMLNPSTADEHTEDSTLRKCIQYAQNFGYGSLEVVNLFAMIATKPKDLLTVSKEVAIGPHNSTYLNKALRSASLAIAAWGTNGTIHQRHLDVPDIFSNFTLHRLGSATKDGHPPHPLYLKYDLELLEHLAPKSIQTNRLASIITESEHSLIRKDVL